MVVAIVVVAVVVFIGWMCFEMKNAPTIGMDGTIQKKTK